jgi:hypothetical protein
VKPEVFEFKSFENGNYTISIDEFGVSIQRKGLMNGGNWTKRIPFTSLTAVQFKPAGMMGGYLQFSVQGGNEPRGGVLAAAADENSITFSKKEQYKAEQIILYRLKTVWSPCTCTMRYNQPLCSERRSTT